MSSKKPQDKGTYEAPALTRVKLVPEEATLVACKSEGVTGPKIVGPAKCLPPAAQCSINQS